MATPRGSDSASCIVQTELVSLLSSAQECSFIATQTLVCLSSALIGTAEQEFQAFSNRQLRGSAQPNIADDIDASHDNSGYLLTTALLYFGVSEGLRGAYV